MKKRFFLGMAVFLMALQLCSCGKLSTKDMLEMLEKEQAISVIQNNSNNINLRPQAEQKMEFKWAELGNRENFSAFREQFDTYYGIQADSEHGKVGMIYTDLEGQHTTNSTLRYAFSNQRFTDCFYSEESNYLTRNLAYLYSDYDTDNDTRLMVLNAYFNIFPDLKENLFSAKYKLSRGEFLAGVYQAEYPVSELEENQEFKSLVDKENLDETTIFSAKMLDYSYLNMEDCSLNEITYNEPITRAEAIYTLVRMYYNEEYESLNGSEEIAYTDAINGGNIALEQGFISKNETTGKIDYKKYWKSYELCYAVHYAENHMPEDLYKAMVIAERHNLIADISNNECKWNEPLTKQMALSLLTNVYLDLGTVVNVEHGYIENYVNKNYPYSEEITERMTKNNLKWYEGTNEGKKIDILKVSKEALALYDILLEGADNDGIDDILIEDVYFEQEVIPVMTIEGELISGTYQKQLEAVHEELAEYANACYQVYNTFLDDHLEVFWLYSGGVTYQIKEINKEKYQAEILLRLRMTNSDTGEVVMSARMKEYQSEERIKEDIAIRDARIAEILKAVEGKSDYEKLLYFYKELTMTNQYNTNLNLPAGGIPRISICAIKGSVGEEGPVCASYAKAYKVLCDAAGIPCIDVGGYLRESSFGLYTDPHQWNYVKLEDKWYLVDATWGDPYDSKVGNPISGYENEEWFLVGSNTIRNGIPVGATRPLSPLLVNTPILSEEEYQPKETEMEKK